MAHSTPIMFYYSLLHSIMATELYFVELFPKSKKFEDAK